MRLIDADALKKTVESELENDGYGIWRFTEIIDNAPTIEPRIEYGTHGQPYRLFMSGGQVVPDTLQGRKYEERPQGKWYKNGQSFITPNKFLSYCCSICHSDLDEHIQIEPNFCPNCGADMRGDTNASD